MSILTVEDVKAHLNLTTDTDDDLLTGKVAAAEAWIEQYLGEPLADFDPAPDHLKEAIRQLVAALYEQREAVAFGVTADVVPFGVYDLLAPLRTWCF